MIIEKMNIYDLLPSQIQNLIKEFQKALNIVKNKKDTMNRIALQEKQKCNCPYCNSANIVKNGSKIIQMYKCKDCKRKFNDLTDTVFAGTHLKYEQIEIFLKCFEDKISIRKTAERMEVNKNTVYLLRQKIINSLKEMRKEIQLSGDIESDEIYRSINLKGTPKEKMPRASKPRTSKGTTTRGISNHKVCIASAIDEHDSMFFEIVGTGPITSKMVQQSLTPKLARVNKLITDCKSSYENAAKRNKWNLKQIKSNGYIDEEGNSLANINQAHSELTNFLGHFRGVSTKHLQGYLDWYVFDRYLNYTYEERNHYEVILNNTMINSTDILTSNMYENQSGINFYEVYSDYHYTPSPQN